MRFAIIPMLALVTTVLAVQAPLKSVIVSYPDGTPDSVVTKAMDAVKAAGGMVRITCLPWGSPKLPSSKVLNDLDFNRLSFRAVPIAKFKYPSMHNANVCQTDHPWIQTHQRFRSEGTSQSSRDCTNLGKRFPRSHWRRSDGFDYRQWQILNWLGAWATQAL